VKESAKHVAPKAVGSQPEAGLGAVNPERGQAAEEQILRQRVLRRDPRCKKTGKHQS
jgi:hypothetical protein